LKKLRGDVGTMTLDDRDKDVVWTEIMYSFDERVVPVGNDYLVVVEHGSDEDFL
jgi:hypothetical protein